MGIFQNIKAALAPSGGNHLEPDDRAPAFARSKGVVTQKMIDSHYRRNPHSFADMLSIVEYLEDSGTFLLDDCFSQAVAIQVSPIATEGRSLKQISELRDNLQVAFRQAFGISNRETDWVLQIFSWKDDNLYRHVDDLREYIHEIAGEDVANSQYSRAYLKAMEMHFRGVNKPDGLFKDTAVTGKPWRGQLRQTYCLIYRRCTKQEIASETLDPIRDINEVAERFTHLLASGGVKASRLDGEAVFRWLTDWFNPNPALTGEIGKRYTELWAIRNARKTSHSASICRKACSLASPSPIRKTTAGGSMISRIPSCGSAASHRRRLWGS